MADVETAKLLIKIGGILSIIMPLVIGLFLFITVVGIVIAIPLMILGYWIYRRTEEVVELIERGEYKKAKDNLIIPMVIALILTSRIGGILMLIGLVLLPSQSEPKGISTF